MELEYLPNLPTEGETVLMYSHGWHLAYWTYDCGVPSWFDARTSALLDPPDVWAQLPDADELKEEW